MNNITVDSIRNPIQISKSGSVSLRSIVQMVDDVEDFLDLNPPYQRGSVWTDAQAGLFMGALIYDTPMPAVFINRSDKRAGAEVVDGKQRITAMYRFAKNEIPAIHPETGQRYYYRDLDEVAARAVRSVHMVAHFVDLDEVGVRSLYLRLNTGGTPHTQEEIEKVREQLRALGAGTLPLSGKP